MKRFLIMSVLAVAAVLSVNAQDEWKHEIGISYGVGAFTDVNSSYLSGIFSGKQTSYIGPFGVEYFYRPKSRLGVGVLGTFSTCKWNDNDKERTKYFGIMPAVKYNWLNRTHFSMYSKLALGVIIGTDTGADKDKTKATFGWQASAAGIEFGKSFRGFLELGFGEQGILLAGLRYKF